MKATCTDKLLRMFWTSCSELSEGLYGIQITKTNTNNCNCCTPCQQWECTATLVLIPSTPAPVLPNAPTWWAVTDSNGWAYDCWDPILTWIASATSGVTYTIREWASVIASLISGTSYILTWVSDWLHTYTIEAVNANGSSSTISVSFTKTTCATAPDPVTNVAVTDWNGGAYDCGDPIITWTASTTPWALYTVKEWATVIASWLSWTSYTISWATVWSHTYTVEAYNGVWSSAWVNVSVTVVACLSAPWNVTGTINVYDSGTAINYTCGTWFDVDFTDVATATYYQLFEWATQIGSNSSTSNFVVTGQSVGSHTYTIYACNWAWCSTGTNFTVNVVACWPYTITWGGCNRFLAYGAANTFWCNIVAEALIIQESTSWVIGTKDVTIVYDFTSIDSGAYTIITLRKYDWWATELWDGTTSSWSTSSWTEFYIWNIADPAGTNYTWTVTFTNVDFSAWYNAVTVDHWVVFPWKNITYNSYTMTVS